MNVRVKICGITNLEDALVAVDAGADALGFIFYESSPRKLSAEAAGIIIRDLPPFVAKVGVFVNADEKTMLITAAKIGLDTLQLHGDEPPAPWLNCSLKTIKAFRMRNADSLRALSTYDTSAWLLDSFVPDQPGGTGAKFNWDLAVEAKKIGRPIILAGGLTPENVAEAVRKVRPFAVDVSSGVESSPGRKDHTKLRRFIAAAKSASEKVRE
jgi:phosphoribosylanthranilate isomerase